MKPSPDKNSKSLTANVYDIGGKVVETMELPASVFAHPVHRSLMVQAIQVYRANHHQGTAKTKTRGEVAGSTVKLYRQKGTGRARAGSRRAPQRVGGGVVFGPVVRDLSRKLPKKMRRAALLSAFTSKWQDQSIVVMTGLSELEPKTKLFAKALESLPLKGLTKLVILPEKSDTVVRGMRNIPETAVVLPAQLNTYQVLSYDNLIFTKEAVEKLQQIWTPEKVGHAGQ